MIIGYSLACGCAVRVNIQHPVSGNAAIDLYGKRNLWRDATCTLACLESDALADLNRTYELASFHLNHIADLAGNPRGSLT